MGFVDDLFQQDPLGRAFYDAAEDLFNEKELIQRIRNETKRLGEESLNLLIEQQLTSAQADALKADFDKLAFERRIPSICANLAELYRALGIIRAFTNNSVLIGSPQDLRYPIVLRAYDEQRLRDVGRHLSVDMEPLIAPIKAAQSTLGVTPKQVEVRVATEFAGRSPTWLVNAQAISATKVYFLGPVFYADAGDGWTITFSTGSGLPDPLEWNGSDWFSRRYQVPEEELAQNGMWLKNPFRSLNFAAGIASPLWAGKRLYVWQRRKTSGQVQNAYKLAAAHGNGQQYLRDAVNQLVSVFRTPNLKVIELETFDEAMRLWTRLSEANAMISCRPETSEARIGHALWFRPGLRLGDGALKAIESATAVLTGLTPALLIDWWPGKVLGALAGAGVLGLFEAHRKGQQRKEAGIISTLQNDVENAFDCVWHSNGLAGTIKEANAYPEPQVVPAAVTTLSKLAGLSTDFIRDALGSVPS